MQPDVCPRCFAVSPVGDVGQEVRLCPTCDRFFFAIPMAVQRPTSWFFCPALAIAMVLALSVLLGP